MGSANVGGLGIVGFVRAGEDVKKGKGGSIVDSGSGALDMAFEERVYLAKNREKEGPILAPDLYHNIMNFQKMKFTVDVHKADCGCAATLYLTAMVRHNDPGADSDYYCDAGGKYPPCAELDLMEANKHVFRSTAHKSGGD